MLEVYSAAAAVEQRADRVGRLAEVAVTALFLALLQRYLAALQALQLPNRGYSEAFLPGLSLRLSLLHFLELLHDLRLHQSPDQIFLLVALIFVRGSLHSCIRCFPKLFDPRLWFGINGLHLYYLHNFLWFLINFFLDWARTVPQLGQYLLQVLLILSGVRWSFGRIGVNFGLADARHGVDSIALRLFSEDVVFWIRVMVSEQGRRVFIAKVQKAEDCLVLDSIDHSLSGQQYLIKNVINLLAEESYLEKPKYCLVLSFRYLLLNFIDWLAIKLDLFILALQFRQMRYQVKSYRSISYAQPAKDSKENKENNNVSNLPGKANRSSRDYQLNPCKLKLQHKITDVTDCSVSSVPKRPAEQLKTVYTNQICRDYSEDILLHLCQTSSPQTGILTRHQISSSLRSKMVDWMIEVLSSYKMSEETFFRSQHFMDSYLRRCPTPLEVKDLHLVGVTAMFAAAKYEEIHPLKLSVIYDKIARKKFKKSEILQMESLIVEALEFKLQAPSVYDICRHVLQEMDLSLSEASSKYLAKILLYLCKMAMFSSELAEESADVLAAAVVFIALKTLEQVDPTAEPQRNLPQICSLLFLQEEKTIEASRKVLDLAKNFSKYYPSLTNLKKFNKFEYGSN